MIIFLFFVLLIVSVQITNSKNKLDASSSSSTLLFSKSDSLNIVWMFLASVIIQLILPLILKIKIINIWIIIGLYVIIFGFIFYLLNLNREKKIQQEHETIIRIVKAIHNIFPKVDLEEFDFSEIPFTFEISHKNNELESITVDLSQPSIKSDEGNVETATYSLNKNFPTAQWIYNIDFPKQTIKFEALPLPPKIAYWRGSDYRNEGFLPLGVNGQGEVGWNISNPHPEDNGVSQFLDDEGKPLEALQSPSAPQALVVGSTGGGKSISLDSIVEIQD